MKNIAKILLCMLVVFTLTACSGGSDDKAASRQVSKYLDLLKDGDLEGAANVSGESYDAKEMEKEAKIDIKNLTKLMFSNLSYKMGSEKIDEEKGTAVVKVTISNTNFNSIMTQATAECRKDASLVDADEETLSKAVLDRSLEIMKTAEKKEKEVKVNLSKSKDKWVFTSNNLDFQNAVFGQ